MCVRLRTVVRPSVMSVFRCLCVSTVRGHLSLHGNKSVQTPCKTTLKQHDKTVKTHINTPTGRFTLTQTYSLPSPSTTTALTSRVTVDKTAYELVFLVLFACVCALFLCFEMCFVFVVAKASVWSYSCHPDDKDPCAFVSFVCVVLLFFFKCVSVVVIVGSVSCLCW